MIIQHNIAAINSYRNLGTNQSALSKNLEKLSSGYKINRAGDNAAGLAISESMRSQINGLNQAVSNANDAIGLIQTAEGALTETHSMLQRLTTLATQAANGTYNSVARGNIQVEVDRLLEEIDRIANYTDFNGIKPLTDTGKGAVSAAKMTFQIGPSGSETITVSTGLMTSAGIKVDTINLEDITDANKAIDTINSAINKVSTYRAQLGAAQNRLEHTISNLDNIVENTTSAEAQIRDTDIATEMVRYANNNILQQAGTSMLSQANQSNQLALSLLG